VTQQFITKKSGGVKQHFGQIEKGREIHSKRERKPEYSMMIMPS